MAPQVPAKKFRSKGLRLRSELIISPVEDFVRVYVQRDLAGLIAVSVLSAQGVSTWETARISGGCSGLSEGIAYSCSLCL